MNNREIERKFVVEFLTYDEAFAVLNDRYTKKVDSTSYDLYWKAPNVDFVRLRENSHELTVKVTDKRTIVDRIEENIIVTDGDKNMASAARTCTLLFGEPMKLIKTFSVFDTLAYVQPNQYEQVVVCLYTVYGDPKKRLFLEVESGSLMSVDRVVSSLINKLELTPVHNSLYQIFTESL